MHTSKSSMIRRAFIRRMATRSLPVVLGIIALALAFLVYNIVSSPGGSYELLLLMILLFTFAYPALKKRYGQSLWDRLPPFVQRLGSMLRIVLILLRIGFWLLLGWSMPLLLVLACIQLMVENFKLRSELEARPESRSQ